MAFRLVNQLDLAPPSSLFTKEEFSSVEDDTQPAAITVQPTTLSTIETEFSFELPKGFIDVEGRVHRQGVMRLARAIDEITPMSDPRVKRNPAYATVIILSRVILQLGSLVEVTPTVIENLFSCDLNHLQNFYLTINALEDL